MPRAEIFMAFDALNGYRELLEKQEEVVVEKRILDYEDYEILNRTINEIEIGNNISVIYFNNGKYYKKEGRLSKLNYDTKMLQIVKQKILFKNIVELKIIDQDQYQSIQKEPIL